MPAPDEGSPAALAFDAADNGSTPTSGASSPSTVGGWGTDTLGRSRYPTFEPRDPTDGETSGVESDDPNRSGVEDGPRRLLVPFDGSEPSVNALEHACSAYRDQSIVALYVFRRSARYTSRSDEPVDDLDAFRRMRWRKRRRAVERTLEAARARAAELDVELATATATGDVPRAVVASARERDADQIVVGTHGRTGVDRLLRGSTAEAILRRSSVPVTVVPAEGEVVGLSPKPHVLVPVDDSSRAIDALTYAFEAFPGAAFTVLHAVGSGSGNVARSRPSGRYEQRLEETRAGDERRSGTVASLAEEYGVECSTATVPGAPSSAIVEYATDHGVEHVVIKRRSRPRLLRAISRGVSSAVVRRSPAPVTVL